MRRPYVSTASTYVSSGNPAAASRTSSLPVTTSAISRVAVFLDQFDLAAGCGRWLVVRCRLSVGRLSKYSTMSGLFVDGGEGETRICLERQSP